MKGLVILALCIIAVHCNYSRERPNFDCDRYCRARPGGRVCSTNGNTFDNECYLECFWEYKDCDGPCPCRRPEPPRVIYYEPPTPSGCYCKREYDPVCTTDNETYDNKCEAECENKLVWHDGPCY